MKPNILIFSLFALLSLVQIGAREGGGNFSGDARAFDRGLEEGGFGYGYGYGNGEMNPEGGYYNYNNPPPEYPYPKPHYQTPY